MNKLVVVGNEFFEEIIHDNGYYVDKTELIYDLAAKTSNKVTLFTRPRRFGKTLMMSTIESFFDIRRDSESVFKGLNISENHPEFCREWMNQYPVLFVSLKSVEALDFENAFEMLVGVISDLCKKFDFLEHNDKVNPSDSEIFHRLKSKDWEKDDKKKYQEIKESLKLFTRMLYAVYGKPVILLIDEYDVPIAKAHASKDPVYYKQMLDVIRGLMGSSLKTNEYLKFAVITGCLRISKESIFTGLNNFKCYSVLNKSFSKYFGFNTEEVKEMLDYYDLSDKFDIIKEWYDGYIFGETEVFCPWDVTGYISDILEGESARPQNYWANTSSNSILDDFVNDPDFDVTSKFEELLNGGYITQNIVEELTYDQMTASENNFWSVLLMTGYVSKADNSDEDSSIKLRIPNAEITCLFKDAVVARFNRTLDRSLADEFINAMWNRDEETAGNTLSDILWNSISYFDYGEEYYHGMLNGIFTSRGYSLDSNAEAGLGRLDLRIKDRPNRRIILLEFKRSSSEKALEKDCDDAIAQIRKKGYNKTMPYGYRQQVVYGVAFFGKTAMVKLMKE